KCYQCGADIKMGPDGYYVNVSTDILINKQLHWRTCKSPYFNSDEQQMKTKKEGPMIGIGGAPTRATTLPADGVERKKYPLATGLLDYFPDALVAVAHVSYVGNEQHNPGKPLHWDRSKSADEADTAIRHFVQR